MPIDRHPPKESGKLFFVSDKRCERPLRYTLGNLEDESVSRLERREMQYELEDKGIKRVVRDCCKRNLGVAPLANLTPRANPF